MPLPFQQKTLAQLRQQIGYLMQGRGKFFVAAAAAGAAGSITLPFAVRYPTDYLAGRQIYIYSGTGAGQIRFCTGSTTATGVCTVSPNWVVVPDATSLVEVWADNMTPDEVVLAINRAIDVAAQDHPVYVELTTGTLDSSRQVLTLPASLTHFAGVYYTPNLTPPIPVHYHPQDAEYSYSVDTDNYRLVGNKVYLSTAVPADATSFTVRGYRLPQQLTVDASLAELPADYLVFMAAADLEAAETGGPAEDPEAHNMRAANWFRKAAAALARLQAQWEPNTELVLI